MPAQNGMNRSQVADWAENVMSQNQVSIFFFMFNFIFIDLLNFFNLFKKKIIFIYGNKVGSN